MRVAALYDVHGNFPALQAVLRDVRRLDVDAVVVGGDVLPGPMPRESLAAFLNLDVPTHFIQGNGDREVLAHRAAQETPWYAAAAEELRAPVRWTAEQLDDAAAEMLTGWPSTRRLEIDGLGTTLFCHATPRNDTEIFTRRTAEEVLAPVFAGVDAAVVICGHTHMPFDRTVGETRVVNAGSVGMPFGKTGADWLLLDDEVAPQHTDYDLADAAARIRQTDYPQADDFAARFVLDPPTEEEMLDLFGRSQIG